MDTTYKNVVHAFTFKKNPYNKKAQAIEQLLKCYFNKELYIYDTENDGIEVLETTPQDPSLYFQIKENQRVYILPIDSKNGLLGHGVCDFIFFNVHQFCFVELKLNAISLKKDSINKNIKNAIGQLTNTINLFDTHLKEHPIQLPKTAFIVFPDAIARHNSSKADLEVEFYETTRVKLSFSRTYPINN